MYYCNNCKNYHDDSLLKEVVESHGEPYYMETHHVCGHCGSDDYEEADYCPLCGQPKKETEDLCNGCENAINQFANDFIEDVTNYFNCDKSHAIDYILSVLEGIK